MWICEYFWEKVIIFLYILWEDPLHVGIVSQCTGSIIEYQWQNDSTYEFLNLILKIVEIILIEKYSFFKMIENPSIFARWTWFFII